MPDIPGGLHIHDLREDESARISWDEVSGAAGYILERSFDQTFDQASKGLTWASIKAEDKTWAEIGQANLSWAQIEDLSALGLTWDNIDYAGLNWLQIEAKNQSWQELELQSAVFEIFRGSGTQEQGYTWRELEDESLNWFQIEAMSQTWDQFENARKHRSATDNIPIGVEFAYYRISAYDSLGAESAFLTSSLSPVIPIFYRADHVQWHVSLGQRYLLLIEGAGVRDVHKILLTLRYSAGTLLIEDFMAHIPDKQLDPDKHAAASLRTINSVPGEVKFVCTRQIPLGKKWGGCVTWVQFVAIKNGIADIRLY